MTQLPPSILWKGALARSGSENTGLAPHTYPRVSRRQIKWLPLSSSVPLWGKRRERRTVPSLQLDATIIFQFHYNLILSHDETDMPTNALAALHSKQPVTKPTDMRNRASGSNLYQALAFHPYRSTCVCIDATRVHRTLLEGAAVLLKQVWGSSHRTTRLLSEGFILLGSN